MKDSKLIVASNIFDRFQVPHRKNIEMLESDYV